MKERSSADWAQADPGRSLGAVSSEAGGEANDTPTKLKADDKTD